MQLEEKKLVKDMLDAAEAIASFVAGKTFQDMQSDRMLRSAVYYQFMIIGEALSQLRGYNQELVDRISESPRIVGFRNQLVHGYSKINDAVTWRIIETKLAILRKELEQLLSA